MSTSFRTWLDALGRFAAIFGSTLAKNCVVIRFAEAPEQIGRVERRGAMLKKMMSKVITDTHAAGRESMDMILSEGFESRQRDDPTRRFCPSIMGTLTSSTKLETLSRIAEKHEQANMECNGALDLDYRFREGQQQPRSQPRTCWKICDSVPVCVAVDRLRPCTSAELLAFHYTQTKSFSPLAKDVSDTTRLHRRTCSAQSDSC